MPPFGSDEAAAEMIPRSWLFVPGDSERKIERAAASGADALIFDLEDAVAASRKDEARRLVRQRLSLDDHPFVRINGLRTGLCDDDLAAILGGRPRGVLLPKCEGASDLEDLSERLTEFESREGVPHGSTLIVAIVTETARGVLRLVSNPPRHPRLFGLMWGAEDLSADVGAFANREANGAYRELPRLARSLCLLAAAEANVLAIDAVDVRLDAPDLLLEEAKAASIDGFSGKAAIHPDQIAPIHAAFTPSSEDRRWAEEVRQAFAEAGATGAVRLHGKMLDKPHLRQAERILARSN